MFDISFGELLICAVIALLVLGPERLPTAARTVGRWVGRARHTVNHFTDQIDREIRAEEFRKRVDEEIRKSGVNDVARQVNEALHAPLQTPKQLAAQDAPVPENSIAPPVAAETPGTAPVSKPDPSTDRA